MPKSVASTETKGYSKMREARINKGLSQTELAELVGIGVWSVGKYESFQREPHLHTAAKIAGVLGIKIEDILIKSEG